MAEIAVEAAQDLLGFSIPSVWVPTEDGSALTVLANSAEHQQLLDAAGTPSPRHPRGNWFWDVYEDGETVVESPIRPSKLAADVPLEGVILVPLGDHGVLSCASRNQRSFTDESVHFAEILGRNTEAALDQLRRQRRLARFERIVENLPVGVFRNTPGEEGKFVFLNDAMVEMFDADSKAQLRERSVSDLYVDPEDRERFSERLLESGVVDSEELRLRTLEGDSIWGAVTAIVTEEGDQRYFDGAIQDISERKAYEQRLERQNEQLELLNRAVRHDIRNDMQTLLARTEILEAALREEHEDPSDLCGHVDDIRLTGEHIVGITKNVRDLMDAMLGDQETEPIPIAPVLEEVVETVRSTHENATVVLEDEIPTVHVEADQLLSSVFRNLVKNGIQHNDADTPVVEVAATTTDEQVQVTVSDNGPGVPDDRKDQIFGKGNRGLESDGTGIGLYLVDTLVENYDGNVAVRDNEPRGAVFEVELPVYDAH